MTEFINAFPGYYCEWDDKKKEYQNYYRGINIGRGGYVYGKQGIFTNVSLLDVRSEHPHSIVALNYFGNYTPRYKEILDCRIAIKEGDYESARKMFDGKIAHYLDDPTIADQLSGALKIVANSAYGMTAAKFENIFRDSRNINNIVALRGALFMKTLQDEVAAIGYPCMAIRTDSIKIPHADQKIVKFCMDFAVKYGYVFEHEAVYDRICLVDDANYIAAYMKPEECMDIYGYVPKDNAKHFKKHTHPWTATGIKFQRPYIFKTLFSGDPIEFGDYCETNSVKDGAIYLDMNEGYPDVSAYEKELESRLFNAANPEKKRRKTSDDFSDMTDDDIRNEIAKGHSYQFIGRVGRFFPIRPGAGGGTQVVLRNDKYSSVSGSSGYRWLEAELVKNLHREDDRDLEYHATLERDAVAMIDKYGSFDRFIDLSKPYDPPVDIPCGKSEYTSCSECPDCEGDMCHRGYSLTTYSGEGGESA